MRKILHYASNTSRIGEFTSETLRPISSEESTNLIDDYISKNHSINSWLARCCCESIVCDCVDVIPDINRLRLRIAMERIDYKHEGKHCTIFKKKGTSKGLQPFIVKGSIHTLGDEI